jgi:hypothetical protein
LIFGGARPVEDDNSSSSQNEAFECGNKVILTNETHYFNVTNGEIKRGPDLSKPSYYISGGYIFPQQCKINAFGFTTQRDNLIGIFGLSAESSGL